MKPGRDSAGNVQSEREYLQTFGLKTSLMMDNFDKIEEYVMLSTSCCIKKKAKIYSRNKCHRWKIVYVRQIVPYTVSF